MEEMFSRSWDDLIARDSGPLHFRLFLQPLVAAILAIRAGWADAWEGRPIFFWTLARDPAQTRVMLRNLWRIAGKVFLIARECSIPATPRHLQPNRQNSRPSADPRNLGS